MNQGDSKTFIPYQDLPTAEIIKPGTTNKKINKLILDQGAGMHYDVKNQ